MSKQEKQAFTTQEIVMIGMFAAILAVISQISLPMPSGVPMTIQVFGVVLVGAVLGWRNGCLAVIVYILLGTVGLPIFANFQGGPGIIAGMSGGYVMAWPITALLAGIRPKSERKQVALAIQIILALIGLLYCEFIGGLQWSKLTNDMSYGAIMAYSFVAFIPKDAVLTVLAVIIGDQIRKPLVNLGYRR